MSDIIEWPKMLAELKAFPANGQRPADDKRNRVWIALEAVGLIEYRAVQEPCKTCGTLRERSSFYRPTPAGRLLVQVAAEIGKPK